VSKRKVQGEDSEITPFLASNAVPKNVVWMLNRREEERHGRSRKTTKSEENAVPLREKKTASAQKGGGLGL